MIFSRVKDVRFVITTAVYKNNIEAMGFVCDSGHVGRLSWQNFRRGVRCNICKNEAALEKKYCTKCGKECKKLERGMCSRCYKSEYGSGECQKCGVYGVLTGGLCNSCYGKLKRPRGTCIFCSREKIIHTRKDGQPVCSRCYSKYLKKKEECGICGNKRVVHTRNDKGAPICNSCYRKTVAAKVECFFCGKREVPVKNTDDGPICKECYAKEMCRNSVCIKCGAVKQVYATTDEGDFCQVCYRKFVKTKESCDACGEIKCIDHRREGLNLCGLCADKKRRAEDPQYRCLLLLRGRVRKAFHEYSSTGKIRSSDEYGIDYAAIIERLGPRPEGDFHIDHILPLSAFDFDNQQHIVAAFAPENHQWLPAKDNLEKHNKYDEEEFIKYLDDFLE